jgi:hypothetical protein
MDEMIKHEQRSCPRCKVIFECKVGSIELCQCRGVKLNDAQRTYLQEQFSDCLCANCMEILRTEYNLKRFKIALKKIIGFGNR